MVTHPIGNGNNFALKGTTAHVIASRAEMCMNVHVVNNNANIKKVVIMTAQKATTLFRYMQLFELDSIRAGLT